MPGTCIPFDEIKELSIDMTSLFGRSNLTVMTVHGELHFGNIPDVPKFLEVIRTLGFQEKTSDNPTTMACCGVDDSPFQFFFILFGAFQLMAVALFIGAVYSGSLLFILESSIAPIGALLFPFIIASVVMSISKKKIVYEHPIPIGVN